MELRVFSRSCEFHFSAEFIYTSNRKVELTSEFILFACFFKFQRIYSEVECVHVQFLMESVAFFFRLFFILPLVFLVLLACSLLALAVCFLLPYFVCSYAISCPLFSNAPPQLSAGVGGYMNILGAYSLFHRHGQSASCRA